MANIANMTPPLRDVDYIPMDSTSHEVVATKRRNIWIPNAEVGEPARQLDDRVPQARSGRWLIALRLAFSPLTGRGLHRETWERIAKPKHEQQVFDRDCADDHLAAYQASVCVPPRT
jgi:hypothetical protein